jgi:DNA-directed RNA polymerase subunit RPC12/RpoP
MRDRIVTFKDCATAEPVRIRLLLAGLAAEVEAKDETNAEITVPEDQFGRAQQLLLEWDKWDASEEILREAIRCPECGSFQVHYPQFVHRSFIPNLLLGLRSRIRLIDKEYHCDNCRYRWPKHGTKRSALYPKREPYCFVDGIEQSRLRPVPGQHEPGG